MEQNHIKSPVETGNQLNPTIKVVIKDFYSSNPKDKKQIKDRVIIELDMSTEEWESLKPQILYPHVIKHNRRKTDPK